MPATKVAPSPAYMTADGRPRTKAMTWELVQDADQVATLATYAICNAREIDGIVLPCKVRWIGYKPGDAVTVSSSVVAMDSQLVVIRKRNLDPASGAVTFTCRTETSAKHAYSLGQTTTPPPTPALATVDRTGLLQPGISALWSATRDDEGTKPDDNATNSADPTSAFGTTTVSAAQSAIAAATSAATNASASVQSILDQIQNGDSSGAAAAASAAAAAAARDAAQTARDAAQTAAAQAQTAQSSATDSKTLAASSAGAAQGSASAAAGSAGSAAASSTSAGQSASSAQISATNAATSAGQSSNYAGNASTSAGAASVSASNAQGSANTAASYATNAASSRDAAGNSASGAATSASVATSQASNAGVSATSAQTYANTAQSQAGNAALSASSASSSSAAATSAAAAAQQSATLASSVGGGYLNQNAQFSSWASAGGNPDGWYVPSGSRVAGLDGPYAVQVGNNQGVFQSTETFSRIVGGAALVIEADLRPNGDGNGIYIGLQAFQDDKATLVQGWYPTVGTTPAENQQSAASTYTGDVRRYRMFIDARNAAARYYKVYVNTAQGYASTCIVDKLGIRLANAAEIAGQRAGADASTALAQVSSNAATQASVNSAQATTNQTLIAQMAGTTGSGLSSQISQTNSTVAANASTASQQINILRSSFATLSSPNLLANGSFANGLSGWVQFGGASWFVVSQYTPIFAQSTNSGYSGIYSDVAGIQPGKNYCFGFEASNDGGDNHCYMSVQWFDSNGNQVGQQVNGTGTSGATSGWGNRISNGPFVAPSGASVARVVVYLYGSGSNYRRVSRIQFQQSDQPTAYSDSASLQGLQAQLTQQAGTLADINNNKLAAYFSVTAQAANNMAYVSVFANNGSGGVTSGVILGGNTYVQGNLIVAGSIDNAQMAASAVQAVAYTILQNSVTC